MSTAAPTATLLDWQITVNEHDTALCAQRISTRTGETTSQVIVVTPGSAREHVQALTAGAPSLGQARVYALIHSLATKGLALAVLSFLMHWLIALDLTSAVGTWWPATLGLILGYSLFDLMDAPEKVGTKLLTADPTTYPSYSHDEHSFEEIDEYRRYVLLHEGDGDNPN